MSKTRKANGEGSIFQVSEKKWVAKISMGIRADGKPNIKQFSGKTEAIVKKKLKEFKKSDDFSQKHIPKNYSVQTYFSVWLKEFQYNKLKSSSYDRLESTVINHIYPNIGGLKLTAVTREQIQTLINNLYKKNNLSYSSVKKVYVALNSCYNHALLDDIILKNPCVGIVLPTASERTKQVTSFSQYEIELLKNELNKKTPTGEIYYQYSYAFNLILNTGLRIGEALSLTWDDIDFENNVLTVKRNNIMTKKRDENGNITGGYERKTQESLKTSSGKRTIPLNKSAENSLLELKKNNDTPYVIINKNKTAPLPSNFERGFHTLLKNAGIKKCGIHTLRHTFASMLFSKGVDVKIVSQLLGHSTVKITYDTYVHLFEKDIQCVTDVLD